MPVKHTPKTFAAENSTAVANAVRKSASEYYRDRVGICDGTIGSLREMGQIIMNDDNLSNEFLSALTQKIVLQIVTSHIYENPWSEFRLGTLEVGETVEEICVDLIDGKSYNASRAEKEMLKRVKPDVRSAYHMLNVQGMYKVTIEENQLQRAFLNESGMNQLIDSIVEKLTTSAEYDSYQFQKYLLARWIVDGKVNLTPIPEISEANIKNIASVIKETSGNFEFLKTEYNYSGIHAKTDVDDQRLITDVGFNALFTVSLMAFAFDKSEADVAVMRKKVDDFSDIDVERLQKLMENTTDIRPFTDEEKTLLKNTAAVLMSKDWFKIWDTVNKMKNFENGEGLYWNRWYHLWSIVSASPFENITAFVVDPGQVTGVTFDPGFTTVQAGTNTMLPVKVETDKIAFKCLYYDYESADENVFVSPDGILTVPASTPAGTTITIKCTSRSNSTITASTTVTVE